MQAFHERGGWWVVAQAVLLAIVVAAPFVVPREWAQWPPGSGSVRLALGIALIALGLVVVALGIVTLGRNLTPMPSPKDDAALITSGIFSLVRHPIYGGAILAAAGWSLLGATWLSLIATLLLAWFFDRKAGFEERFLVRRFSEYEAYRKTTYKLIPWIR